MGNILNPSPGDLADRQMILEIKLEHCGVESERIDGLAPTSSEILEHTPQKSVARTVLLNKREINIQPFIVEHEAIQDRLQRDWFTKLSINQVEDNLYDNLIDELRSVHSELWKLEDQARVLRMAPDRNSEIIMRRKAENRDSTTINNDKRAELVTKINTLWGIDVREKIYQ